MLVQTPQGELFLEKHQLANLHMVAQTAQLRGIHTVIRDKACERSDFVFQSGRLIRMAVEEALSLLPTEPKQVVAPTGALYNGLRFSSKICAVSIPRSGDTMEQGIRQVVSDVRIGKILIQRDEHTSKPVLLYSKLPLDIANRIVLLLDPMLATGGSAIRAIEVCFFLTVSSQLRHLQVLEKQGVAPKNIIFVSLFAAPEGILNIYKRFPDVKIVTTAIDDGLNGQNFIIPGCGDFGDRFFGTEVMSLYLCSFSSLLKLEICRSCPSCSKSDEEKESQ